jgi:2',3'-cyclic-nucleotide 2'-phosphodiesterase (5'-nucleotidase family)
VARRATVVNQERAQGAHVLVMDAGDTLNSDHWLTMDSQGKVVIAAMNLMGYDAMALGERDLALGADVLRQRVSEAEFPILSANLILDGELFVEPYIVKTVGEHRAAIIGLTGAIADLSYGFEVKDPVETARQLIGELADQADVVILLVHVGWAVEQELQEIEGVDLIVGGSPDPRTNEALWNGERATLILPSEQPYSGHAGRFVGIARLRFDETGRLTAHESQMFSLSPDIADDAGQVALIQEFQQRALQ